MPDPGPSSGDSTSGGEDQQLHLEWQGCTASCDDGDPCTRDTCVSGTCQHASTVESYPRFYDAAELRASETTPNLFGRTRNQEWLVIKNQADAYLAEPYFRYDSRVTDTYYVYYPYLKPFSHGIGNSLHVGSPTSAAGWARRPSIPALPSSYLIEFDYYYSDPAPQTDYKVWSSYDGTQYDDVIISQTGRMISASGYSNVFDLSPGQWHHFAIFVKADNTYDLRIDTTLAVQGGTQIGNGVATAIGFLGDVSTNAFSGEGYWDNIRISTEAIEHIGESFDSGLGAAWLTYAPAATSTLLSHDDRGLSDFPYWTEISRAIQLRLQTLSFAHLVTTTGGATSYSTRAKTILDSLCSQSGTWNVWGDPDYLDGLPRLDGSHFTLGFAFAYDALYPILTPVQRSAYAACIKQKGMAPLYDRVTGNGIFANPATATPNYYALIHSALGIGSLALTCSDSTVETYLTKARTGFEAFYDLADIDGGWIEGLLYGSYALNNTTVFHHFDEKVTGWPGVFHPYLQRVARFAFHFLVPGRTAFVPFSDSVEDRVMYDTTAAVVYHANSDPYALSLLGKVGWTWGSGAPAVPTPLNLELFIDQATPPAAPPAPLGTSFRTIGWASLRSSWADDALHVSFHSGPTTWHGHLDENDIAISKNNQWLAAVPGYQDYREPSWQHDFTYGSVGHNVLRVNNVDQAKTAGALRQFFAAANGNGYALGSADGPYAGQLASSRRTVALTTSPECVLAIDEFRTPAQSSTVEFVLHSGATGGVQPRATGYDLYQGTTRTATVDIMRGDVTTPTYVSKPDYWRYGGTGSLFVNMTDAQKTHAWEIDVHYLAPDAAQVAQRTGNGIYTQLGTLAGSGPVLPPSWQQTTLSLLPNPLDSLATHPGTNVVIQLNPAVNVSHVVARDVTAGTSYTVTAGSAGDDDVSSHNPGVSFDVVGWHRPFAVEGRTARGRVSTYDLRASSTFAASSAGRYVAAICPTVGADAVAWEKFGPMDAMALIATVGGVHKYVARIGDYLDSLPLLGLAVQQRCDVGVAGDTTMTTPGISLHTGGEWGAPATDSGLSVRSTTGGSWFYVNVPDTQTQPVKVAVRYKAPTTLYARQYFGPTPGYKSSDQLVGAPSWRVAYFYARPPFHDYVPGTSGTQVLFHFSGALTVSDIWSETETTANVVAAGDANDNVATSHYPGVSFHNAEWEAPAQVPAVYYGLWARRGPMGASGPNFLLNLASASDERAYDLEIQYIASADVDVRQWNGTQYVTLAKLPGDGKIRRARVSTQRGYFDAFSGVAGTNVLFEFNAEIRVIDIVARGL